ncbi:MAG: NAD(P)H-dependent glycerol-3-phosphate dehydrogenase [Candidatus Dormibacteria bacterium]
MRIAIVGAGSWGSALAHTLGAGPHEVALWARRPELAEIIARTRRNDVYMPGISLHPSVSVHRRLRDALSGADIAVLAVPTHGLRAITESCAPMLPPQCVVASAAKGFEAGTSMTMTQVIADVLDERHGRRVAAMSGPNIAPEVARGLPAAIVVAAAEESVSALVRDACTGPRLRFYSSCDVIGVEFAGALKNIVAIAAGACDGMRVGDNAKAALITRGIREMSRLGVVAGAGEATFAGLAGVGDCFVTCTSPVSRNRRLGEAIGRGRSLVEATEGSAMVVEGVNATRVARALAERHHVPMPIADEVHAVLFEGKAVGDAMRDLMSRDPGGE